MGSTDLPKTFKAWVFQKPGTQLTLEDRPLEAPAAGEVLIKVEACGICYTDGDIGAGNFGDWLFPRVPGHEIIGHVAATGSNVTAFKVGDRVGTGWNGGFDGTCFACKKGLMQACDNGVVNGFMRDGGCMVFLAHTWSLLTTKDAEYVHIQANAISRIPTDISAAEYAPMLCAGVTVFNGMRQMAVSPGSLVAIHGLGGLGHLAVQFAVKMGFNVVVISRGDKEEFSKKLGASHYIDSEKGNAVEALTKLGRAAMLVACGPDAGAEADLLAAMLPGGKVIFFAPAGDFKPSPYLMVSKCLTVRGWSCGSAVDCEETLDFAQQKGVECMISPFKFEQAQEAFDHMRAGKARFRSVIVM